MSSSINNSALDQIYIASHYTANTHTYTRTRYCTRRSYLTFILHCTIRHTDRHYTIKVSTTTPHSNDRTLHKTTDDTLHSNAVHWNTVQHTIVLHTTLQFRKIHYNILKHTTLLQLTLQYNEIHYTATQYIILNTLQYTILHITWYTLYYTTLCWTMLHYTMLHYTKLCYTILHYIVHYYCITLHYTILHNTL